MFNLEDGYIAELISPDDKENIPKYAIWLDDNNIAVVIGFGSGIISVGGNVYTYNLQDGKLNSLTTYSNEVQITKISKVDNQLLLTGIKYIDEELFKFEEFKDK